MFNMSRLKNNKISDHSSTGDDPLQKVFIQALRGKDVSWILKHFLSLLLPLFILVHVSH